MHRLRIFLLVLSDIVLINFGIVIAYLLRFEGNIKNEINLSINHFAKAAVFATIIKVFFFACFKLYTILWRYASIYEAFSMIKAALISNGIMFFCTCFLSADMPKSIFAITFFIDIVMIGGGRLAYRFIRRIARINLFKVDEAKRVMIIGGGYAGAIVIKELIVRPELKRVPVVIIDDDKSKTGRKINGVPIAGNRKDIVRLAYSKQIDEIIITIPSAEKKDVHEIFSECSKTQCKIKILPGISEMIDGSMAVQKIRNVAVEDLLGREPVNLDTGAISSYLHEQVVLVTGGGGTIGSELCRQISNFNPKQLIILDNNENGAYELQNELSWKHPKLDIITVIANIRESLRLDEIFGKYNPGVIFHAAAHKHVPLMETNPTEAIKNNIIGTLNLVECSEKNHVNRFILISTDKAVNPTSIMGASKRVAEMIIQAFSRNSSTIFAAVRFGNVLGSSGSVIPLFKKQIEHGGPVTVTHPDATRFFMTIPEAAQLVIEAGAIAKGGEIFVLDMGKHIKIYDLAKTLIKLSGFEPVSDIDIIFTGLRPGEKLHEELFFKEENMKSTSYDKIYSVSPVFYDKAKLIKSIEDLMLTVSANSDAAADRLYAVISDNKPIGTCT